MTTTTGISPTFDAQQASRWRAQGWWRDRTVVDDFADIVRSGPDKVAVVSHHAAGTTEVLSFRQLARLTHRFAGALVELGIRPGEPVSFQLPNWWQFTALVLACGRVGAIANPIIPILRRREVGFILDRVESRVAIVPDHFRGFAHGEMLGQLRDEVSSLDHAFVLGDDLAPGTESFSEHFVGARWEERHDDAELAQRAPAADDVAQIQFTSGTTGEPKGVVHTHNTLYAGMRSVPEALGLGAEDVVLMSSTMAHQTGYLYGCLMPASLGMKVVYQDVWDGGTMLELVGDEGVTWTMGATPFVLDAVAAARTTGRKVHSLRYFACAGAPIPPHVVAAVREALGAQLVAIWGMTENGAVTFTRPDDPPDFAARSDGRPVPWMELKVVDRDGAEVRRGEVGRLMARGAAQCVGYFKRPDLYAAALDAQGFFDTGDLARMDETGAIRISGRGKDLIIRGGENVPVLEVEAALYRHPRVREVAVVGYPDERLGERACAVVVPEGEAPTLGELTAHLEREGMARQFWPERLEVVDELPKTPSGKIQKYRLRQRVADEVAR